MGYLHSRKNETTGAKQLHGGRAATTTNGFQMMALPFFLNKLKSQSLEKTGAFVKMNMTNVNLAAYEVSLSRWIAVLLPVLWAKHLLCSRQQTV